MKRNLMACAITTAAAAAVSLARPASAADAAPPTPNPNVVFILCDDLGYGDVHAFNPDRGKIPTPNIDRLARQGMSFTDAHASSAVCTPSRYAILTGRYNWRTRLQSGVLNGTSEPLIAPGRSTVASFLKQQGYATQCFGKWHLGLGFAPDKFTSPLTDTPLNHGFDHFYGIAASLDMPPFAWIEDDHFTEAPTATKKWVRSGPAAPSFEAVDVVPTLVTKTREFLQHPPTKDGRRQPFFLYLALTSPHTPLVPTPQFKGKSGLGDYGDFVMETDWALGEVCAALDATGHRDDTLLFFTSDNGCAPYIGVKDLEAKGHYPSAQFRGYKADIWDGGHRIPLVARWPGVVAAGSKSDQLVGLIDLYATCADLLHHKLPDDAAEDSFSILPLLNGADAPVHDFQVEHSIDGCFAVRQGNWKLELCAGSGGWAAPREARAAAEHLPPVQLYDLASDVAERHNLQADHPDVVRRLTDVLEKAIADGRTTPGKPQKDDAPIEIHKPLKQPRRQ